MAYLAPSDLTLPALKSGQTAELVTLEHLRRELPENYTVFHNVHWTREYKNVPVFGEADFIVVNRAGDALVIEQKEGALEEGPDGLVKRYGNDRKSVARQLHRTLDSIREKFKHQNGDHPISLDYLLYCPGHRVKTLNAVGLDLARIVDATRASKLAERVQAILPARDATPFGNQVRRFFEQTFDLIVDIHAHVVANERAMTRHSASLASTLACLEMSPLRLRVRGTAGSGKTAAAARFFTNAVAAGRKPLLVCFNRPLAERLRASLPPVGKVDTWYGLITAFLRSQGHDIDFTHGNVDAGFWNDLQERVMVERVPDEWLFDTLIVDEGQDFHGEWFDLLQLFLTDKADQLWLEDPDQTLRFGSKIPFGSAGFIGFRAMANYRTPQAIARFLQRHLPFAFEPANALPGLGVEITCYSNADEQLGLVAQLVAARLKEGFKPGDVQILSVRGQASATLANHKKVGPYTLSRFTGHYDDFGNQVYEEGQIRFDTIWRFKGQQAPAVILTDVDPDQEKLDIALRTLFSAATRATVRLDLVARRDNSFIQRLLEQ